MPQSAVSMSEQIISMPEQIVPMPERIVSMSKATVSMSECSVPISQLSVPAARRAQPRPTLGQVLCELPENTADALMSCSLERPLIRPLATFCSDEGALACRDNVAEQEPRSDFG